MGEQYPYKHNGRACAFVCWANDGEEHIADADDILDPPDNAVFGVFDYAQGLPMMAYVSRSQTHAIARYGRPDSL